MMKLQYGHAVTFPHVGSYVVCLQTFNYTIFNSSFSTIIKNRRGKCPMVNQRKLSGHVMQATYRRLQLINYKAKLN